MVIRLKFWSLNLIIIVMMIAALVLLGWQFDIELLKRPIPNLVAMNPLTTMLFILTGLSYFASSSIKGNHLLAQSLSVLVIGVSLYHFLAIIFGFPIQIDQILFLEQSHTDFGGARPNRMAPNTALNFIISHVALLLITQRKPKYIFIAQLLAIFIIALSIFAIVGYVYQVPEYFGILRFLPMAIHTAISFLLIALAILALEPEKGIMKQFTGPYSGSSIAKILIPAAIFAPIAFAYLHLWLHWHKIFSTEFSLAIATVCFIMVFVALIYINTYSLNRRDVERKIMSHRLKISNHQLKILQEETASLNQQLTEALQKEKELVLMKSKFIAIASHEFKTPLSSIEFASGFLRKYKNQIEGTEIDEKLNDIDNQLEHMNYLLNDVLTIGKTEAGKVQVNKVKIEIHQLFQTLIRELTPEGNTVHRITLTLDTFQEFIYYDVRMIRVITVNLLTNAIKFSPGQPEIKLQVSITPDLISIEVKDTGLGIPSEDMHNLFKSFHRSTNVRAIPGTGLGLSIVKKTVDLLHGTINVDSVINVGTTFKVKLPLSPHA